MMRGSLLKFRFHIPASNKNGPGRSLVRKLSSQHNGTNCPLNAVPQEIEFLNVVLLVFFGCSCLSCHAIHNVRPATFLPSSTGACGL